jgi:formate-nitrite transporter family protein
VEDTREVLGDTDAPAEDDVAHAFDAVVGQGAQRLHRSWREVLTTGLAAGLEVGAGVLAYLAVYAATDSHLLAGLAFSIGLVALLLGRSELFTEGFLLPVTAVVAGRASLRQLCKLWSGTLIMNLVGGWLFMWLVVQAFPDLHATTVESAVEFVDAPLDLRSISLALLAGAVITLMTRMQHGTESDGVRVVASVMGGFLLAGLVLYHSILDSLIIFGALHVGAPFGYGDWLAWMWYVTLLNVVGGLLVVTTTRLVRSKKLIERERSAAEADED